MPKEETKDINTMNVYQRIHHAMKSVSYVQREKKSGMQYSVVSHDAVTALVRPALHEAGVVYHPHLIDTNQDGNRTEIRMVVRFVNVDSPEDHIDVPTVGYGIDPGDKGPGKAISYGMKYALLKLLGLETGEDSDNDQQVSHAPAASRPSPATVGDYNPGDEPEGSRREFVLQAVTPATSQAGKTYYKLDTSIGPVVAFANAEKKLMEGATLSVPLKRDSRGNGWVFDIRAASDIQVVSAAQQSFDESEVPF